MLLIFVKATCSFAAGHTNAFTNQQCFSKFCCICVSGHFRSFALCAWWKVQL